MSSRNEKLTGLDFFKLWMKANHVTLKQISKDTNIPYITLRQFNQGKLPAYKHQATLLKYAGIDLEDL